MMRKTGRPADERRPSRLFARLMLPFGIVMIVLSIFTIPLQSPDSAERIVSVLDIVLGGILVVIGFFLSLKESGNKGS